MRCVLSTRKSKPVISWSIADRLTKKELYFILYLPSGVFSRWASWQALQVPPRRANAAAAFLRHRHGQR